MEQLPPIFRILSDKMGARGISKITGGLSCAFMKMKKS